MTREVQHIIPRGGHERRNDVTIVVMLHARYAFASSKGDRSERQGGMEGTVLRPHADFRICIGLANARAAGH